MKNSLKFWLVAVCLGVQAMAAEKPNILFIAIDDQNSWIGHMGGHPMAKTPHLDKLAKRGTSFLNAHCNAPLCNPSRTSLMIGLRPTTTGIYGLSPGFRTLPEWKDRVALPQHLANHGYKTAATGKIYHGGVGGGNAGKERRGMQISVNQLFRNFMLRLRSGCRYETSEEVDPADSDGQQPAYGLGRLAAR